MIGQLATGSVLILLSILVQAAFMVLAMRILRHNQQWLQRPPHFLKLVAALAGVALWLLLAMTITVWIWAIYFQTSGALGDLETSVYFALVSFTTLGFGDVILAKEHRLLSGMLAANGLILFGLTTAFLIEFMQRLYQGQQDFLAD